MLLHLLRLFFICFHLYTCTITISASVEDDADIPSTELEDANGLHADEDRDGMDGLDGMDEFGRMGGMEEEYDGYDDPYLAREMAMQDHWMDDMYDGSEDIEKLERMEMMEQHMGRGLRGGIGVREKRRRSQLKALRKHSKLPDNLNASFPGTKWCGPGNTAANYDDLGLENDTDACCRDHDHCKDTIAPSQCQNGICNNSSLSLSHCNCDTKLRKCLISARSPVGDRIGYIYFNLVQMRCFKLDHPIKKCRKYSGPRHTQCELYELEENRTPQWQAFDQPRFEGLPPLPEEPPKKPPKGRRSRRPSPYMGYPPDI